MKVFVCLMFVCLIAVVYSQGTSAQAQAGAAGGMFGGRGASSLFTLGALGMGSEDMSRLFMCRTLNIPIFLCMRGMM